jgi:hypothetical protein
MGGIRHRQRRQARGRTSATTTTSSLARRRGVRGAPPQFSNISDSEGNTYLCVNGSLHRRGPPAHRGGIRQPRWKGRLMSAGAPQSYLSCRGARRNHEPPRATPAGSRAVVNRCPARGGYRCFGPQVSDGAIVYEELTDMADLPVGWGARQRPGAYRLEGREDQRCFAWANGPQALKPLLFRPGRPCFEGTRTPKAG